MVATDTIRRTDDVHADPVVALRHQVTGATWPLPDRPLLTIGSSLTSDVTIAEPGVSAHHATIERVVGGWRLWDAASKNGCFSAASDQARSTSRRRNASSSAARRWSRYRR